MPAGCYEARLRIPSSSIRLVHERRSVSASFWRQAACTFHAQERDRFVVDPLLECGHVEALEAVVAGGTPHLPHDRPDQPRLAAIERQVAAADLEVCRLGLDADRP